MTSPFIISQDNFPVKVIYQVCLQLLCVSTINVSKVTNVCPRKKYLNIQTYQENKLINKK